MADVTDESYGGESYAKPRHRRDREERRQRKLNRSADIGDSPGLNIEQNSSNVDDSVAPNEQFLSPDYTPPEPRKERRSRSKQKDEVEIKVTDEDGTEGAVATDSPARTKIKKDRKSENSARKRQAKKNLREKRRSTGVVIMPHMESDEEGDEEKKALKVHTQQNEQLVVKDEPAGDDTSATARSKSSNKRIEQQVQNDSETIEKQHLTERIEDYELQIDDFKSKLEKANKELDQLRLDNQRLKDENSALLRVVNQLSTMKGK